jgi:hypothetical protein
MEAVQAFWSDQLDAFKSYAEHMRHPVGANNTDKGDNKRWGWSNILGWYREWAFWGSPRRIRQDTEARRYRSA